MALRSTTVLAAAAAALIGLSAAAGAADAARPGALAVAVPAPAVQPPTATLDACHAAPDLADRYATFAAQMTAVPGTTQMSIRLLLEERTPVDVGFRAVAGVPGFGVWKNSAPGVGIFGYSQEVTSLTVPAEFRVTVNYRWTGVRRKVIKRAERMTPSCNPAVTPSALVVGSLGG